MGWVASIALGLVTLVIVAQIGVYAYRKVRYDE
jgi:hypothetical protein